MFRDGNQFFAFWYGGQKKKELKNVRTRFFHMLLKTFDYWKWYITLTNRDRF